MVAKKLVQGDAIGIVCPSHIAESERYTRIATVLEGMGYKVKPGANIYSNTDGYLASAQERADDFNAMVLDDEIRLVLFGGGECGNELLPLVNFEAVRQKPKLYCSFSDGTTLLNAVHAKTGLVVYYGQAPGMFGDLRHNNYTQFMAHLAGEGKGPFVPNSPWHTLNSGACEGTLMGGYLSNFALLQRSEYLADVAGKQTVLFLEDHESFSDVPKLSSLLSHIEQSPFITSVVGLLFGHYSTPLNPQLLARLERFGQAHKAPVVYCDDFGHGVNRAILPIGAKVRLDADKQQMVFL